MTTRKPERGGPVRAREPYNIPIRFYRIDDGARRIKRGKARRSASRKKTASGHELIEVKFGVQGGNPVIKGTRVPVRVVLGALGAGESMAKVRREYRISRKAVLAAISYAAELLTRENVLEILGDVVF